MAFSDKSLLETFLLGQGRQSVSSKRWTVGTTAGGRALTAHAPVSEGVTPSKEIAAALRLGASEGCVVAFLPTGSRKLYVDFVTRVARKGHVGAVKRFIEYAEEQGFQVRPTTPEKMPEVMNAYGQRANPGQ